MRLIEKLRRKQPAVTNADIEEIQKRVRAMREQVGCRDIDLAELFMLVREDERPLLREIDEVKRPELARVWPEQVPSVSTSAPKPTFQFSVAVEGWAKRP
jgi:hypothetical protein